MTRPRIQPLDYLDGVAKLVGGYIHFVHDLVEVLHGEGFVLIREHFNDHQDPHRPNSDQSAFVAGNIWDPAETNGWTSESHALVEPACYPPDEVIQSDFADRSRLLIQEQWLKAGKRLARILNATLGNGEVVLNRDP